METYTPKKKKKNDAVGKNNLIIEQGLIIDFQFLSLFPYYLTTAIYARFTDIQTAKNQI